MRKLALHINVRSIIIISMEILLRVGLASIPCVKSFRSGGAGAVGVKFEQVGWDGLKPFRG